MRPDGFSYDRRIKNDRRLSYSVQDGLLGLDVEQVDLVGIEGNADGVSVAGLGGGSDAGGHLVALVLQVQVDLSAHHLRDIDLSIQLAVGVLCHELGLIVDVLGTDAHLDLLADVGIQLAVSGLLLGQGDEVAAQIDAVLVALLDDGAVQEVHLGAADEACDEHVAGHIVQVLRGIDLLDEPLSNLDAKLRTSMRTEIIKLHKKLATTFIYVTHDQTEAMTMGDRIVVMKDGIIQQVDTPQNLYDMPCNMFVAGFIGSPQMNFLDGTLIKKGELYGIDLGGDVIPLPKEKTADGKLDAYVGKKVKLGIRPEDIDDEPEFMAKHTDCQLDAQVDVSEMMGAEIYLYLEYKGNKMTARVDPTSKARNGDTVRVAFDPHKVHLFDVETELTILN